MKIFTKQTSNITYDQLFEFILKMDNDFVPPLSARVNLNNYVTKLLESAEVLTCFDAEKIAGVLAFYHNDYVNKYGYITYLAIDEPYRGKGIATQLLDECISYCKKSGMYFINVETWETNKPVLRLYMSKGFDIVGMLDDRIGEKSLKLSLSL